MSLEQLWFVCSSERKLDTNIPVGLPLQSPYFLQDISFYAFNTQSCDRLIIPVAQEMNMRSREFSHLLRDEQGTGEGLGIQTNIRLVQDILTT